MENLRLKPSAYETFQKVKSDLNRYELIVNYYKRNPIRIDEQNKSYVHEIFEELYELADKFMPNKDLSTRINNLMSNICVLYPEKVSKDALEPLYDKPVHPLEKDSVTHETKKSFLRLKPIGGKK